MKDDLLVLDHVPLLIKSSDLVDGENKGAIEKC